MSEENASQPQPQPPSDMIPKARLDDALAKLDAEKKKNAHWQTKYEQSIEAMEKIKADHTAEIERIKGEHENERIFGAAGIDDPDVVELVRRKYDGHTPEEGAEKPAFADWFKGYAESKPAILRPFLKESEPAKQPAPQPPPAGGAAKAHAQPPPKAHAQGAAPNPTGLPPNFHELDNAGRRKVLEEMGVMKPKSS